jgi:hypothetical protein
LFLYRVNFARHKKILNDKFISPQCAHYLNVRSSTQTQSAIFANFLTALGEYTGVYFDAYLGKYLCVYTFFISQEYQMVTIKRFATS